MTRAQIRRARLQQAAKRKDARGAKARTQLGLMEMGKLSPEEQKKVKVRIELLKQAEEKVEKRKALDKAYRRRGLKPPKYGPFFPRI